MILDLELKHEDKTELWATHVGGKRECINENHYPYFYCVDEPEKSNLIKSVEKVTLKRLSNGRPVELDKVSTFISLDVPKVSNNLDAYENQIYYHNRFIIDEGVKHGNKMPKVLAFDIETPPPDEFSFATSNKDPVVLISVVTKEETMYFEGKEADVLMDFMAYIFNYDPDVITHYSGNKFDIPYVIERCEVLGIAEMFGRHGNAFNRVKKDDKNRDITLWYFPGRVNFDLYPHAEMDDKLNAKVKNRGLKEVSRHFWENKSITKEPILLEESFYSIWNKWINEGDEEAHQRFIKYCIRDSELAYELCTKIYFPVIIASARDMKADLQSSTYFSQYWLSETELGKRYKNDYLCDGRNDERNYRIYRYLKDHYGKVMGAYTGIGKTGLYWNPFKMDYVGYYNSIMRKYNLSPETCKSVSIDPLGEFEIEEFDDKYIFHIPDSQNQANFVIEVDRTRVGVLAQLEQEYYDFREKIKIEKPPGWESQESSVKMRGNAAYGYNILSYANRGSILVGIVILGVARNGISEALDICAKAGATINGWDTDGIMLCDYYDYEELAQKITDKVGLLMQVETGFKFILVYKSKCYAVMYKGNLIIHGGAFKGRNKPNICDKVLDKLIMMLAENDDNPDLPNILIDYLESFNLLDFPLTDFVISVGLGKNIDDYDTKKTPLPHVRVAIEMQKRGSRVQTGDEIYYFYGVDSDGKLDAYMVEDFKLVDVELTSLTYDVLNEEKKRSYWVDFYHVIKNVVFSDDYGESFADVSLSQWGKFYYYFDKIFKGCNFLMSRKIGRAVVPTAKFFLELFEGIKTNYNTEEMLQDFFHKISGVDDFAIEDTDSLYQRIEDLRDEKYEKFNLDEYIQKYKVDCLSLGLEKYSGSVAGVIGRVLWAYFSLDDPDETQLNEIIRLLTNQFMGKQKISNKKGNPMDSIKYKLWLWFNEREKRKVL